MILDGMMSRHKTFTANVQQKVQTMTNGVPGAITWSTVKTVDCIFYRGGISSRLISEKFRADVSATMLCRPTDFTADDLPKGARIEIKDGSTVIGYYSAYYADDIAGQDAVIMLPLKEFT